MPNTNSAKKALRQTKKLTVKNKIVKDTYKKAVKAVNKGLEAGKDVKKELSLAQKKLDKAAKNGVIKKNTAARKLSRLAKKITKSTKK